MNNKKFLQELFFSENFIKQSQINHYTVKVTII